MIPVKKPRSHERSKIATSLAWQCILGKDHLENSLGSLNRSSGFFECPPALLSEGERVESLRMISIRIPTHSQSTFVERKQKMPLMRGDHIATTDPDSSVAVTIVMCPCASSTVKNLRTYICQCQSGRMHPNTIIFGFATVAVAPEVQARYVIMARSTGHRCLSWPGSQPCVECSSVLTMHAHG